MLKKRTLAILLSLAMLLSFMPVMSFAEDVTDDNANQNSTVETAEEKVRTEYSTEETEEAVETIEPEEKAENETIIDSGEDDASNKEATEGVPEEDVVNNKYNSLSQLIPQKEGKCSLDFTTWEAVTEFTYDGHSIVYALAYAEDDGSEEVWSQGDEIAFEIYRVKKGVYSDSYEKTLSVSLGAETWYWIIADNGTNGIRAGEDYAVLKEGETYQIRVRNKTSHHHEIGYLIKSYDAISNEGSLPVKVDLETAGTEEIQLKTSGNKLAMAKQWESSDERIVQCSDGDPDSCFIEGISAGTCNVTATLLNGEKVTTEVTVTDPSPYIEWAEYDIAVGDSFVNKICFAPTKKIKWSSSNKKVATVNKNGKVHGKKPGKCTIKAKCAGITYTCKVEVYRLEPDFFANLEDYDTYSNVFTILVYNNGDKPLTFNSKGAKAVNSDYKKLNRKLKLTGKKKSITVNPGCYKEIKYKVNGRTTWYDVYDFTLVCNIKYNGATYPAKIEGFWQDSTYRKSKKEGYYYTYWYEDLGSEIM